MNPRMSTITPRIRDPLFIIIQENMDAVIHNNIQNNTNNVAYIPNKIFCFICCLFWLFSHKVLIKNEGVSFRTTPPSLNTVLRIYCGYLHLNSQNAFTNICTWTHLCLFNMPHINDATHWLRLTYFNFGEDNTLDFVCCIKMPSVSTFAYDHTWEECDYLILLTTVVSFSGTPSKHSPTFRIRDSDFPSE